MKSGLKQTLAILRKDFQIIISISYLLLVAVGMFFTHKKYAVFGIDIFEYADVFDFLIAPFSDVKILWFTALTLLLIFIVILLDVFWKSKSPVSYSKMYLKIDKKSWFKTFRFGSFLLLLFFYLNISANIYGESSKKEILTKSPVAIKYTDNTILKGIIIGKTKEVLFVLEDQTVKVIPITSTVKEFGVHPAVSDIEIEFLKRKLLHNCQRHVVGFSFSGFDYIPWVLL